VLRFAAVRTLNKVCFIFYSERSSFLF